MSSDPIKVPAQYQDTILTAAKAHGIAPADLAALLYYESSFDPRSRSSAGAIGIAQFMPSTAASMGVNPYDPTSSIRGAARYLDQLGYRKNRLRAFAAYNAGPGNIAAGQGYAQHLDQIAPTVQWAGGTAPAPSSSSSTARAPASAWQSGIRGWLARTALTLVLTIAGVGLAGTGTKRLLEQTGKVPA